MDKKKEIEITVVNRTVVITKKKGDTNGEFHFDQKKFGQSCDAYVSCYEFGLLQSYLYSFLHMYLRVLDPWTLDP